MEVRGAKIIGLGSYVPERVLTNFDLEKMVDTTDEWIVSHTGMKERRIAAPEQATSDLATEASKAALADAGLAATELDLILVATVTPDMIFPSVSSLVQGALGATHAGAVDAVVGCTGFVYGLASATAFIQSGMANHVLVIAAETLSRIVNWEDRSTCVLFGDGAGAVVVGPAAPGEGIKGFELWSDGTNSQYLKVPGGGSRRPMDEQVLRERAQLLAMDGHEVFKLAVRGCPDVAEAVMKKVGVTHDDIDWAVFHQANRRILDAAAKRLDIPVERVYCDVERYANTSAATIPLAMDDMYKEGKLKTGDLILLTGFGAGFSLAAGLLEWTK
ncbi:MAG: ketoacyl-ACP synthase III [Armatimonadetes bacterium]|nr:ketoacyl-ACP synthase III [Armatimonadota bacterium]